MTTPKLLHPVYNSLARIRFGHRFCNLRLYFRNRFAMRADRDEQEPEDRDRQRQDEWLV